MARQCRVALLLLSVLASTARGAVSNDLDREQFLFSQCDIGRQGGRLTISQRTEPKTLNPVISVDGNSREILGLINADLIHINRYTHDTEPALARSWTVSPDSRVYTLQLRTGLTFSDGQPFDADDVLFSFQVYLDERVHSPQRDLLLISGKPIRLQKIDKYTVRFELEQPYAAAERLFDSIAILPRHLLLGAYEDGRLAQAWSVGAPRRAIAGLGPFRLKDYVPGQHMTLERNPFYWKRDRRRTRLPYLDEIDVLFTGNADAEAMRFQQGDIDIIERLSAATFSILEKHGQAGEFHVYDLGPGMEYSFLVFNLNDLESKTLPSVAREQTWFRKLAFRQAVSAAIDREAIIKLAYRGRAFPLLTNVTPGNTQWFNPNIPKPVRSVSRARQILHDARFSWTPDGRLLDEQGAPISFSIIFNAANAQHSEAATLLQQDLAEIGIDLKLVPMEFHALLNRIFESYDYDAAIMTLMGADADPNSDINVLTSDGSTHLWNLGPKRIQMPWENELDRLMRLQMITLDYAKRRQVYDRVQQLVWENLPMVFLLSPDVLVGAKERVGNFRPAILANYTLWNAEELFLRH